jgi:hypothetical protein
MEEVWDILLTQGKRIYGIAVDDAHHYQGEFSSQRANPGRAWVVVKATELSSEALMEGLEAGLFYASTGVELEEVLVQGDRMEIQIRAKADFKYTTTFLGSGGKTLAVRDGPEAVFILTEPEPYVRAKVVDSGGSVAWVQPAFLAEG